jgi:hypothetical protein
MQGQGLCENILAFKICLEVTSEIWTNSHFHNTTKIKEEYRVPVSRNVTAFVNKQQWPLVLYVIQGVN